MIGGGDWVATPEQLIEQGRGGELPALLQQDSGGGDSEASYRLAVLHARGAYMRKDWPRALDLLALSVDQGCAQARTELALISTAEDHDRPFGSREVRKLCDAPRVHQIDGFLSAEVCEFLIDQGRNRLRPAGTLERDASGARVRTVSDHRTNSAIAMSLFDGGVIMALIAERISRVLKVSTGVFEAAQIFHYAAGQEFRPHVDYIEGAAVQRIATFLVYLNDDFDGGETWFPYVDLRARTKKGGAVFFHNVDDAGAPDPMSVHAGTAPTSGEKWLLSQWVRDQPYMGD